jgi:hypothetical protein
MSTTATPAANETKPDATATPAPATNATPAPTDKAAPAPAAADTKATGTAPAASTPPPAADAGETVDDGDDTILDLDDDGDEPAEGEGEKPADGEKAEGDKPAEPKKDDKPEGWTKERDAAADAYIKRLGKKLTTDKDGKPLSDRQRQANIDDAREKFLSRLAKYPTREAALLALIEAQNKISSGKYKAALPKDATDEEIAAWRKENGIPEDAKGYKLPQVQGEEWTEADKPGLDKLLGRMHAKNASQDQVNEVLTTYKEIIEEAKQAHAERVKAIDRADTEATRDALRDEFEGEFKPAMTLLKRVVNDPEVFPEEAGKLLAEARTADGRRLINNKDIAKFLINYAKDIYGEGSMISGEQQAASNTEEQELVNLMNTDIDAYMHKPWKTTGMTGTQRYLEIQRKKEASGRGRRAA